MHHHVPQAFVLAVYFIFGAILNRLQTQVCMWIKKFVGQALQVPVTQVSFIHTADRACHNATNLVSLTG